LFNDLKTQEMLQHKTKMVGNQTLRNAKERFKGVGCKLGLSPKNFC
jgi:hypothetical protein